MNRISNKLLGVFLMIQITEVIRKLVKIKTKSILFYRINLYYFTYMNSQG